MENPIGQNYLKYPLQNWVYPEIASQIISKDLRILLLKIEITKTPSEIGSKNLIAINRNDEIVWVASLPNIYPLVGFYDDIILEGKVLKALCGSILCDISLKTGEILKESFIK